MHAFLITLAAMAIAVLVSWLIIRVDAHLARTLSPRAKAHWRRIFLGEPVE